MALLMSTVIEEGRKDYSALQDGLSRFCLMTFRVVVVLSVDRGAHDYLYTLPPRA